MTGATHQFDLGIFEIVVRVLVEFEVAEFALGAFGKVSAARPGLVLDADAAVGEGLGDLVCVDGLEPDVSVGRVVSLFGDGSWCGCWEFPLYAMLRVAWKGGGFRGGKEGGQRRETGIGLGVHNHNFHK